VERWLSGLDPPPNTIGGFLGALQRAFRHHNYAMELESRLRSRKQVPGEPVMSYCYDIIYLCSKVDPAMPEERKVQFIFQNMEPTLMEKVFPQMDRLKIDELFRRLQAHSQAALIAERLTPVNNILPVPPVSEKEEIEKFVREEVSNSLDPIVRKLEEATQSMRTAGESEFGSKRRTPEDGQNQDRPTRRTIDGQPICHACGSSGHVARRSSDGRVVSTVGTPDILRDNVPGGNKIVSRTIHPKSWLNGPMVSQIRTGSRT
jgi:hypothetical protein